ncbi:CDI toxin immunity protein [Paenibacillus harenae]|uniref:CDI toxin immunity protein n=1 Tax=Paenibacillus harenae TaxID=306543 RepID=UPI0040399B0D
MIKTKLETILKALDDVFAVSFDTRIYRPDYRTIIDFFHNIFGMVIHLKLLKIKSHIY